MKMPIRPTTPPWATSRPAAPVERANVLDAVGVLTRLLEPAPVALAALEGEGTILTEVYVFSDTGLLGVLVGRTTVEFARVMDLMLVLVLVLLLWTRVGFKEVLCTETGTLVVELLFKVTICV